MKYKKQIRWLLFLLIPFVILLIILILAPVPISNYSIKLAGQSYISSKISLQETERRSYAISSSQLIQNVINRYFRILEIFNNFTQIQQNYMKTQQSIIINSAYSYDSLLPKSYSMWFSQNIRDIINLPPQLKLIYSYFLQHELLLRSQMQFYGSSLQSFTLYCSTNNNKSIYFQNPSRASPSYIALQTRTNTSFYQFMDRRSYIENTNKSFSLIRKDEFNESILVLCRMDIISEYILIPCIHINIIKLGQQLQLRSQLNLKMILLVNIFEDNKLIPIIQFPLLNNNSQIRWIDINQIQFDRQQLSYNNNEIIKIKIINKITYFLTNIQLYGLDNNNIMKLYMKESDQNQFIELSFQKNLNVVIISVVISTIIGCIVSGLALKYQLDTIQSQLFVLQDCCKFIVDGDINIQIPSYDGAKNIKQVYDQARIINKLHRFSTNSYFTGHFAEKILKYKEALVLLKSLNYDVGNILQNMGQAYFHLQQWDKSIDSYSKSVSLGLDELQNKFGLSIDDVLKIKKQKQQIPQGYKQLEIILIRRMFKLTFTQIKYTELRPTFTKVDRAEKSSEQAQFQIKLQKMMKQSSENLRMLKIAFYPDYSSYSQCIIALTTEYKYLANLKNYKQANRLMIVVKKIIQIYTIQYPEITKKLKQKGSKYKLLHQRNKLTAHSRTNPELLRIFRNLFQAKVIGASQTDVQKNISILNLLIDSIKVGVITLSLAYMVAIEIRKLLIQLKIEPTKFQSTQVFRQVVPFMTLYTGERTKEIQPQLLKYPTKVSLGLERQFVYLIDCADTNRQQKLIQYFTQRSCYIFNKLIKKTDRLSIIKYNLIDGIKLECGLVQKHLNEAILAKELQNSFKEQRKGKGSLQQIILSIRKAIFRIKNLQSQKVIIIFLKNIEYYNKIIEQKVKKKFYSKINNSYEEDSFQQINKLHPFHFGENLVNILKNQQLRNCKLIFYCAPPNNIKDFRKFFGFQNINNKIWNGFNSKNIVVYIIDQNHKLDIDRILMLKTQDVPDNHVFIL